MKRALLAAFLATLTALAAPAAAHAYQPGVAYTRINPVGKTQSGTGTTAAPAINAEVATIDTGSSINSTGVGTGFQAQGLYVSVLYENGSKTTGPAPCLPAGKVNFGDRIIGAWVPDGSTTRVLAPVTEIGQAYSGSAGSGSGGQLVGNWDKGTISVRRVDLIKPPTLYANLQSCGRVHTLSATTTGVSNLVANADSTLESLDASKLPSIPTLRSILQTPTNPLAPSLPVGVVPSAPVIPTPAPVQTVTQTQTITTPAVTVTTPAVTITTPPITVPSLTRR